MNGSNSTAFRVSTVVSLSSSSSLVAVVGVITHLQGLTDSFKLSDDLSKVGSFVRITVPASLWLYQKSVCVVCIKVVTE